MAKISLQKIHAALFEASKINFTDILQEKNTEDKQLIVEGFLSRNIGQSYEKSNTFRDSKLLDSFETHLRMVYENINSKNKYFKKGDEEHIKLYKQIYLTFELAYLVENNGEYNQVLIQEAAYNFMVWFGDESARGCFANLDRFFNRNASDFHEFVFHVEKSSVPNCPDFGVVDYELTKARNLLRSKTNGYKILETFFAMQIIESKFGKIANDAATYLEQYNKFLVPNSEEDPDLAEFCVQMGASNFSQILHSRKVGLIPVKPKPVDEVPNIHLSFHSKKSNYHLVKLPETNPLALYLGSIVGNCQSWGAKEARGNIDTVILDALHRPKNGFYIIVKESSKKPFEISDLDCLKESGHEIIGESPVSVSEDGSMIFSLFAIKSSRVQNINIMEVMNAFGAEAAEHGIHRIMVGGLPEMKNVGGEEDLTALKTNFNSIPAGGYQYSFALHQHEAYISAELAEARSKLKEKTSIDDQSHITSLQQASVILEAWDKIEAIRLPENYQKYTNSYVMDVWRLERIVSLVEDFEKMKSEKPELHAKIFNFQDDIQFVPFTRITEFLSYKYGIKIEYIYNLPDSVIEALFDDKMVKFALDNISDMQILQMGFGAVDSVQALKKVLAKGYASDLAKEDGDLGYIDSMSEDRLDSILENPQLLSFGFTNIRELSELSDANFEFVFRYLVDVERVLFRDGFFPKLSEIDLGQVVLIHRMILKGELALISQFFDKCNPLGDDFIDNLSPNIVKLLASKYAFEAICESKSIMALADRTDISEKEVALNILKHVVIWEKAQEYLDTLDEDSLVHICLECNKSISLVFSEMLLDLYISGATSPEEIMIQNEENLASKTYFLKDLAGRAGSVTEIINLDNDIIHALSDKSLLEKHDEGILDLRLWKNFDLDKIHALKNFYISEAVKDGRVKYENLESCTKEQIDALNTAISRDWGKFLDIDHLRCQDAEVINAIAELKPILELAEIPMSQYDLAQFSAEEIRYLFSYEGDKRPVMAFCNDSKISFSEFLALSMDKITFLLEGHRNNACRLQATHLDGKALCEIKMSKLRLLLSDEVDAYFNTHYTTRLHEITVMEESEIMEMIGEA